MLMVDCAVLAPDDWDEYVLGHADATVYHLAAAVGIGRAVFGLRCHFLTARDASGRLCGVLPLVEQRIVPGLRCLISLPFFTGGGVLATDDRALHGLLQAAEQLAAERRAGRIVLRHGGPVPAIPYTENLDKVAMVLPLPDSSAELQQRLGSKLRSQIRRAERENPEVRVGGAELIDDFYPVFCSVMRDLGTPVYPRHFFSTVCAVMQARTSLVVVYLDGTPVAGAVLLRWRDSMEVPWAATLGRVKGLAINMRLYWELLQCAMAQGCKTFDFGRSSVDAGTYRFKSQWGAKPVQLHWYCSGDKAAAVSQRHEGQSTLDLAVRLWRRMPLPVANWLGPRISPYLPW
jgi:FemAB-related protein (PEP-CTERM system-associated)